MNDQIPNTDDKRAVERWENEGGKCLTVMKVGSTARDAPLTQNAKGELDQ